MQRGRPVGLPPHPWDLAVERQLDPELGLSDPRHSAELGDGAQGHPAAHLAVQLAVERKDLAPGPEGQGAGPSGRGMSRG